MAHSVARTDIRSTSIYNPSAIGHTAGVWIGSGVTRTKPSPTLFMATLPHGVDVEAVRRAFQKEPGFVTLRTVRRMQFVDFIDERAALAAMRAHQGEVFPGANGGGGLILDFDKDDRLKRDTQYERQVQRNLEARTLAVTTPLFCKVCHASVFSISKLKAFETFPRRGTDRAYCIEEAVHLKQIECTQCELKVLRREKGLEKQYPLACPKCSVEVAYRSVPLGQDTKFLYVLPDAVSNDDTAAPVLAGTLHDKTLARQAPAAACGAGLVDESLITGVKRQRNDISGALAAGAASLAGKALRRDPAPVQLTAEAIVSGLSASGR